MITADEPTKDLSFFFMHSLSLVYRKFTIFLNEELKEYNLSAPEYPCLMFILFYKDGILQDDLVRALQIAKSATTRTLQSLEDKGFIKRVASTHSLRHKHIYALPKALALKDTLYKIRIKWENMIFASVDTADKETTLKVLRSLSQNIQTFEME